MIDKPIFQVTFLRHGESVGNAEERFQGQADYPLTERGLSQARELADQWRTEGVTFDQCIASPLLRASQTADIISQALGIPVELDSDWMEINNGLIAGLTTDQALLVASRPDFMTPYTRYGQTGESRWEVFLRAGRALQHILDRSPGRYLVVAHAGVLNMALYAILGIPVQADSSGPRFMFHNATHTTFTYEREHHNWRMINFGEFIHWKDE